MNAVSIASMTAESVTWIASMFEDIGFPHERVH